MQHLPIWHANVVSTCLGHMDEPKNVFKNVKPNSWFTYIYIYIKPNGSVWQYDPNMIWNNPAFLFYFYFFIIIIIYFF